MEEWDKWLSERPDNVKNVASKILPWKLYRMSDEKYDLGHRYYPVSYEEDDIGNVTVSCMKVNERVPIMGGYVVFGIDPDNLIEETI